MFLILTDYDDGYGYNYDNLCKKSIAGMENICQEQVFENTLSVGMRGQAILAEWEDEDEKWKRHSACLAPS